ncbi:Suppressor of SWI4 1 -like protein [Caligus rogercresseyi]|uniref:Suppressor of SWI4 1 -like protein n=1 Tax=Caligus rogercresseyi TaxID=217165 RepID=A0A7T8JYS7_CALRO|nr:Suppressor of SWI4 1 -like protein [Caligus rogercresseyi]
MFALLLKTGHARQTIHQSRPPHSKQLLIQEPPRPSTNGAHVLYFPNMFPSINVTTLKLNTIRRCVLLNYDSSRGLVDFRHYTIKIIVNAPTHKIPNLSRYENVQDYFEGGAASESEAEEDESAQVNVALKRLNQKSSIKLVELGPRLSLEPIKIQEGLLDGDVLYHKLQSKTPEEAAKIKEAQRNKMSDKEKRRKEQEKNVRRKEKEKKAANAKAMEGMKNVKKGNHNLPEGFKNAPDSSSEEDNDAEWFQKEVGEAPESDLFDSSKPSGRKRKGGPPMGLPARFNKKFKKDSHRGEQRKGKRPQDVFNNQGVGPNYNKNKVNKGPRMSLCCEIGCRERLPLGISVEGNPPPSLYATPVVKNPPRKAHN